MAVRLPTSRIARTSPVPFYFQLKKTLAEEILTGRWTPGERLPSEPAICEHFEVSRTTVRQALAELEAEAMIRRDKGRGTFVADPHSTSWLLQSSGGFFEEAVRAGHTVISKLLRRGQEVLPSWACDALELPSGSEGMSIERLRWVDGRLVMYVVNHLPARLTDAVIEADLATGSLYRTLEDREGLEVFGGRRVVEAVTAQEDLARLLEVEAGAPLLLVESVSWDRERLPFECYRAWHRADRTRIEVQVVTRAVASRAGFDARTLRIEAR
ncbi:MAG: GntR family transcriptional regulator [Actinomycetota bacterium]